VDGSLGKEDGGAVVHWFHDAIDHDTAISLDDVDHFFAVGMRVSRPYSLARSYLDDAHGAVLRVDVLFGDNPA